jgi:hypothetical protein
MPHERRDASARSAPVRPARGRGATTQFRPTQEALVGARLATGANEPLRQLLAEALQARGCGVVAEAANGDANGPRCGPLNLVGGPRLAFGASRSNPPGVTSQLRAGQTEAR